MGRHPTEGWLRILCQDGVTGFRKQPVGYAHLKLKWKTGGDRVEASLRVLGELLSNLEEPIRSEHH